MAAGALSQPSRTQTPLGNLKELLDSLAGFNGRTRNPGKGMQRRKRRRRKEEEMREYPVA